MSEFSIFDKTKFLMDKKIGRGSFGYISVYRDLITGLRVAVKEQALHRGSKMEAEVMMNVKSERVIKYLDHIEKDGTLFIIMELADGDLFQLILNNGPSKTPLKFWNLAYQLAEGIHAIHDAGYIHRDLKPSNILFKNNKLKIADFGLSARISRKESKKIGTMYIRAPEMLFDGLYTEKVDIWSLGCVFIFISTGLLPFQDCDETRISIGKSVGYRAETYYLKYYRNYPKRYPERPAFPKLKIDIGRTNWFAIDGCLKTDPASRYDSHELLQRLNKFPYKSEL